jgi:hypothetical protein
MKQKESEKGPKKGYSTVNVPIFNFPFPPFPLPFSYPFSISCSLAMGAPIIPQRSHRHSTSNVQKGLGRIFLDFVAHSVIFSVKYELEKRRRKGAQKGLQYFE